MIFIAVQMMDFKNVGDFGIPAISTFKNKSRPSHASVNAPSDSRRFVQPLMLLAAIFRTELGLVFIALKDLIFFSTKQALCRCRDGFSPVGYLPTSLRTVFYNAVFIRLCCKISSASYANTRPWNLVLLQISKPFAFIRAISSRSFSVFFNFKIFFTIKAGRVSCRWFGVIERCAALNITKALVKVSNMKFFFAIFTSPYHGSIIQTNINKSRRKYGRD